MRNHYQSIPDRSRPGLPTTASGVAQQSTCGNYATAKHSEEAARSVQRKTLTHKGGYFKYWNDDWKGKKAGRYDRAKECRHIVSTGNKVER